MTLEQLLESIHVAAASAILAELKKAKEEGGSISPQLIAQAINLLKHNGIQVTPSGNTPLEEIADELDDYEAEFPEVRH